MTSRPVIILLLQVTITCCKLAKNHVRRHVFYCSVCYIYISYLVLYNKLHLNSLSTIYLCLKIKLLHCLINNIYIIANSPETERVAQLIMYIITRLQNRYRNIKFNL